MCILVCEGFGVFIVGRVDIRSLAQRAFPCREDLHYYAYFVGSFPCRNSLDQGQSWSTRCFLIYSCVEAKQGHVRLIQGLLIPFNFLPSASYPVYAFWSSYSSVVDLKAYPFVWDTLVGTSRSLSILICWNTRQQRMSAELPLSTRILCVLQSPTRMLTMSASLWGWWRRQASSSKNSMMGLSICAI